MWVAQLGFSHCLIPLFCFRLASPVGYFALSFLFFQSQEWGGFFWLWTARAIQTGGCFPHPRLPELGCSWYELLAQGRGCRFIYYWLWAWGWKDWDRTGRGHSLQALKEHGIWNNESCLGGLLGHLSEFVLEKLYPSEWGAKQNLPEAEWLLKGGSADEFLLHGCDEQHYHHYYYYYYYYYYFRHFLVSSSGRSATFVVRKWLNRMKKLEFVSNSRDEALIP